MASAATALQALPDVMVEAPGGLSQVFHRLVVAALIGSFSGHVDLLLER
jgi:hypothetical protein